MFLRWEFMKEKCLKRKTTKYKKKSKKNPIDQRKKQVLRRKAGKRHRLFPFKISILCM